MTLNIQAEDTETSATKKKKKNSQPRVTFVGDANEILAISYVDVSGNRLKFANPVKAIEVCFHCFMGMNVKYPKDCGHVWEFIQRLVFGLTTKRDKNIPGIDTLINDLINN